MRNVEVNGLWIAESDELTIIPAMCIKSYLKHGHRFILWSYNKNFKNLPEGCILKDANMILDSKLIYECTIGSYGHFSDWWRWKFLYENGGFWSDLDVCCLNDDIPMKNGFHICSMTDSIYDAMVGTLMLPKSHIVSKTMLDICTEPYKITEFDHGDLRTMKEEVLKKWSSKSDLLKNAIYPSTYRCFGHVLDKYGVKDLLPKETVYPVSYDDIQHLNLPSWNLKKVVTDDTFAIHLWGSKYYNTMKMFIQIPCILRELYMKYYL